MAYEHFVEAQAAKQYREELLQHLEDALHFCQRALDTIPPNAVNDLAATHNQLGVIYGELGDLDRALLHYRESIRYGEIQGNLYNAARTRYNVAFALAIAGRFADALEYANAALQNFETYGESAAEMLQMTQEMIAQIEQAQQT